MAPKRALTASALQARITECLGEVAEALEPICGPSCRSLTAEEDLELEVPVALTWSLLRRDYVVIYRPEGLQAMVAHSESLTMYGAAHEMGHYIDFAIAGTQRDHPWRLELTADTIAGCALATLGLPLEPVRAAVSGLIAPEGSYYSQLELTCGYDRQHPAPRWQLEAFDTGAGLCRSGVAPLERLASAATELAWDATRESERVREWFPADADPCGWSD